MVGSGNSLKREEAIAVLKEIVEACKKVDYANIILKPPGVENNMKSEGFELHIKDHFNQSDYECLTAIIQKRNLNMKKYDGYIVVYKPKSR